MTLRRVKIEVWDKAKKPIADISELAQERKMTLKRNGIGSFSFWMDFPTFQRRASELGLHPRNLIYPLNVDLVMFLDDQPWQGFEVVAATPSVSKDESRFEVRALGFLSLFNKRFVTKNYAAVEATEIPRDLITTTQATTLGDFGVTIGAQQYETGFLRDRGYERQRVSDAIINLTRLESGNFDFNFTYDKQFETYAQIGSLQADTPLKSGDGGNVELFSVPTEGASLENALEGLGFGFGQDQLASSSGVGTDGVSMLTYGRREGIHLFSSVSEQVTLDENTGGALKRSKDMLQIPQVTTTSNVVDLLSLSVGDRFPVDLRSEPWLDNVHGLYRLEQVDIDWDTNDFARLAMNFDDQGVEQDES